MLDTLVGAAIGILVTFMLWPSREAHFLRQRLAEDLRGNGRFLLAALNSWLGTAAVREASNAGGKLAWQEITPTRHCPGR